MASSDKELEHQLLEAGNQLEDPPSSVDELLPLLDRIEDCLSRVEQSPTKSMQTALAPSLKALVTDKLFGHSNMDVRVAVASCISEITRITAPDAPYDDDQMKDVFQLIVSSFENLADKSSRSYDKRTSILETVAKVRSCVVMLDLECEGLIIEMFRHFFNTVRDYHPENVILSMETTMILVLEESEDISPEMLSPLLDSVKKGNEGLLPVARKLGEKVLESCASKVKPYLVNAVRTLGLSLDAYSDVVATICQNMSTADERIDVPAAAENKVEESKPAEVSLDETVQAEKDIKKEASSPREIDPPDDKSIKSVISNGVAETEKDDSLAEADELKQQEDTDKQENTEKREDTEKQDNSKKQEDSEKQEDGKKQEEISGADQSKSIETSKNVGHDDLVVEEVPDAESEQGQIAKVKGKKANSSAKAAEFSEGSCADTGKEDKKVPDHKNKDNVASTLHEDPALQVVSSDKKETASESLLPKAVEGDTVAITSPTVGEGLPDENSSKKALRIKKKEKLMKDSNLSDNTSKRASDGASESETKANKSPRRSATSGIVSEDEKAIKIDASKEEGGATSESEAKLPRGRSKKVEIRGDKLDGSSSKQSEKRSRNRGKSVSEKHVSKTLAQDDDKEKLSTLKSASKSTKEEQQSVETPKTGTKRKRDSGKDKVTDMKEDDDGLVGAKVKVWWPLDKKYYKGTIESYDPIKKRHKVVYVDGDVETLILKRQKWELIGSDSESNEGEATDHPSPDDSSEMPLRKKANNSEHSTKHEKMDSSHKGKSQSGASKSGRKSKEAGESDGKPTNESKALKKTEDDNDNKNKDQTPKGGNKSADAKGVGKSKNDDVMISKTSKSKEEGSSTPKASKSKQDTPKAGKSKQDTPKVMSTAKEKLTKISSKSSANGTGKSGSSKVRGVEMKESKTDSIKGQVSAKGKIASSSKGQGSEGKNEKKRRRAG
ncbi:hypothetical protein K2173_026054 [Erythroxylum novogranatense]|uniref:Uncharacterized protein n=1 Tax=Erythroxylum novogranatense TaxID=1862640 RepID=A0AAV8SI36_9ROSI|nr:hypothetical protein K2173_026054 [Erythroxylum novogranatense]